MRLRQEVMDDVIALDCSDWPRCYCGHPNASPPCNYCTHPGNPAALEYEESWETPEDYCAYAAAIRHGGNLLVGAGLTLVSEPAVAKEWLCKDRFIAVGLTIYDETRTCRWYSRSTFNPDWKRKSFWDWFDTAEAALVFATVQASLEV